MMESGPLYSVKRPNAWLWRTGLTRAAVEREYEVGTIASDWLVCPLGEAERAVSVDRFLENPRVLGAPNSKISTPPNRNRGEPKRALTVLAALATVNFFGLVLASPNLIGPLFGFMLLGAIPAEISLVAVWSVFSNASFGRRLLISAAMGCCCFFPFAIALLAVGGAEAAAFPVLGGILLICPLALFTCQAPLLVARYWFGLRIARDEQPAGSYVQPFGIRDFLLATAGLSVAMGLVRLAALLFPGDAANNLWAVVAAAVLAPILTTVFVGPLLMAIFATERFANAMVWLAVVLLTEMVVLGGGMMVMTSTLLAVAGMTILLVTFNASIALAFALTRDEGFEMHWGRPPSQREPAAADQAA